MASMVKNRVFVDSSVFISAVLSSHGGSFYLLTSLKEKFVFQTNEYVLAEIARVLNTKFSTNRELENRMFLLLGIARVNVLLNPPLQKVLSLKKILNVEDTPILASALAHSDYLLTLDNDFFSQLVLEFAQKRNLNIVKPQHLIQQDRQSY